MKLSPSTKGYLRVNLVPPEGGTYKTFAVHRLVLEAFVGPCPPGMECRHFPDTSKANNRLENLSWGTSEANRDDNRTTGAYGRGKTHTQAVLDEDKVRIIRTKRAAGVKLIDLAAEFHVTLTTIHAVVTRRTWRHVD